jgi:hypothetical protein
MQQGRKEVRLRVGHTVEYRTVRALQDILKKAGATQTTIELTPAEGKEPKQ